MSLPANTMKTVKTAAACLVVGAALLIMVPGLLSVGMSLMRLALIVVIAGGACLLLAHGVRKLGKANREAPAVSEVSNASSDAIEAKNVSQ